MIIERFIGEIPTWAKPSNPLLRYEITRNQPDRGRQAQIARISAWVIVLTFCILGGYAYATEGFQHGLELPYTIDLWQLLFFPVLFFQFILRAAGISFGVTAIISERQRQTWDNLRSTERGTEISLHVRWVSILFYRLRRILLSVLTARLILVAAILYELTSMQGSYLEILSTRSSTPLPVEMSVILLAALMTSALLLPITATGVDIALGLLIATAIRNRAFASTIQVMWIWLQFVLTGWLFVVMRGVQDGSLELNSSFSLLVVGGFASLGDWGLTLSQLSMTGELWAKIPYTIYLGGFLLLFVLLQVFITSGLLRLAAWIAEHRE